MKQTHLLPFFLVFVGKGSTLASDKVKSAYNGVKASQAEGAALPDVAVQKQD